MPHRDEARIHAWLDGELDAAESARVSELVARDGDWAAAAAEARGLIAASSRIIAALDRVPGHVVPRKQPSWRSGRGSMIRAAALILVFASAATLWRFGGRDHLIRGQVEPAQPAPASPTPSAVAIPKQAISSTKVPVTGTTASKTDQKADGQPSILARTSANSDLARQPNEPKAVDSLRVASPAPPAIAQSAAAATAGAARDVVGGAPVLRTESGLTNLRKDLPLASALKVRAAAKATRSSGAGSRCFETRQPADSAVRVLKLPAAALADSLKLGVLQLRGDSLLRARRLFAMAVRCPEP